MNVTFHVPYVVLVLYQRQKCLISLFFLNSFQQLF